VAKKAESESASPSSSEEEEEDKEMKEGVPIITSSSAVGISSFKFKEPAFPNFQVKLVKTSARSTIYGEAKSSQSKTSVKK
jgi:hypothetical protein